MRTDIRIDSSISITIATTTTAMTVIGIPLSPVDGLLLSLLMFELLTDTVSVGVVLSAGSSVGVGVITVMF